MIGLPEEIIHWLFSQDKETLYVVEEYKEKRGLRANSYCWTLIGKIALEMNISKEDVYREFIKDRGVYRVITMGSEAVDTFIKVWSDRGLGWLCDTSDAGIEGLTDVIAYYGTSCYNKKQMARFIDYVIEEAQSLGIETLTPDEIEKLKNAYDVSDRK